MNTQINKKSVGERKECKAVIQTITHSKGHISPK